MTQNRKSTRYYSKLQESKVAKVLGGKPTPNSGATKYIKGDVKSSNWLLECKTCMAPKQSFSIKKDWLKGIQEEAKQQGKLNYALVFNYGPNQDNYYILTEKKFKELVDTEIDDESYN